MIRPSVDNFGSKLCSSYRVIFKSFCVQILVSIMADSFVYFADLINQPMSTTGAAIFELY